VNAVTIATAKANAKPWVLGKTPDGQPDLQGYWTNNSIIPLQRPNGVTKEFYTQEEFLARAKQQGTQDDQQTTPGTTADVHYDFTQFGLDKSQTVIAANLPAEWKSSSCYRRSSEARCRYCGRKAGPGCDL
jgi:hypothetical protein